jgi:low affinity Fe/Cu permease
MTESVGRPRPQTQGGEPLPSVTVNGHPPFFERFATRVARWAGRPAPFLTAVVLILAWAVCGPLLGFSNAWQLVINTSSSIITLLMVFLIQHTQNRSTLALQIKLAELILVAKGTENEIALAEEYSEEYLERLRDALQSMATREAGPVEASQHIGNLPGK